MFSIRLFRLFLGIGVAADLFATAALPAPLQNRTPALRPVGASALHWFGKHVYDIALYNEGADYATNSTAALSICYAVSIKHRHLQDTTLKEWKRLSQGAAEQHTRWIGRLDVLWPDVKPGDRLFLIAEDVMLNRAVMSKWGFRLGEVTLSFRKMPK